MGLSDGALPHAGSGPGEAEAANGPSDASLGYPSTVSAASIRTKLGGQNLAGKTSTAIAIVGSNSGCTCQHKGLRQALTP